MDDAILERVREATATAEHFHSLITCVSTDALRALLEERERLKANNNTKTQKNKRQRRFNREQEERQAALVAEIARLRTALEFYRSELDDGKRARAALAPAPEEGSS